MKTISKMLGHTDIAFTMRTYGAVLDDVQRDTAAAIAALISHSRRSSHPEPGPRPASGARRPAPGNSEAGEVERPDTPQ